MTGKSITLCGLLDRNGRRAIERRLEQINPTRRARNLKEPARFRLVTELNAELVRYRQHTANDASLVWLVVMFACIAGLAMWVTWG